jgi:TolB-like protein
VHHVEQPGAEALVVVHEVEVGSAVLEEASHPPSTDPAKPDGETPAASTPSITVVPFSVTGPIEAQDLAEGLAEGLTRDLGKLRVRIIAHSSARTLAKRGLDPAEIGQSLGVDYVVDGRVRQAGGRVRIDANLTRARDRGVVWSVQYERTLRPDELWAIEDNAGRAIAESLGVRVTGAQRVMGSARPAASLVSYRLYVRGRRLWDLRRHDAVQSAIQLFHQVLAQDPGYALAYVGLADAYTTLGIGNVSDLQPLAYFRQAETPPREPSSSTARWPRHMPRSLSRDS